MAMPLRKIYLDPGHGGYDPGGTGNGLQEKVIALKIARYTRDYLQKSYKNVSVRMSRDSDKFVSLSQRAADANNWGADVFVSYHTNAATSSAKGYEDFIFNGPVSSNTTKLQDALHNELYPLFNTNRGQKRANFAVLRLTKMSAVLTESGFITNKEDADFLSKESNLKKIGEAHARGIEVYLGLEKSSSNNTSKPKTSSKTLYRVRKSKNDAKSQLGAFSNLNNAKKLADEHGYNVYSANGNKVYSGSKKTISPNKPRENLVVDGYWGAMLTRALQRYFGTVVDGEIWGQVRNQATRAITAVVKYGGTGSPVIRALQRKVGAVADGIIGSETIRKLQAYLGTPVDGELWTPSTAIKELQRRLNAGTF